MRDRKTLLTSSTSVGGTGTSALHQLTARQMTIRKNIPEKRKHQISPHVNIGYTHFQWSTGRSNSPLSGLEQYAGNSLAAVQSHPQLEKDNTVPFEA